MRLQDSERSHILYAIDGGHAIKFGVSSKLDARVAVLQSSCSTRVSVLSMTEAMPGVDAYILESAIHRVLGMDWWNGRGKKTGEYPWLYGEWFAYCPIVGVMVTRLPSFHLETLMPCLRQWNANRRYSGRHSKVETARRHAAPERPQ